MIKVKLTKQDNAGYYHVPVGTIVVLSLDTYLCGVVSAEVGNAGLECCKAQAVASRTSAYPYYSQDKPISDAAASVQCFNAVRANSGKYPNAA